MSTDPLIGTLVGDRYQLIDVVGKGGMGIVYRAADTRLSGRPCAVKLLSGKSMDPEEATRFARELQIISRLRSPHVVQVVDTGSLTDGRAYIVMELLEGLPLSGLLRRAGALDPRRAMSIAKGVLAALAEAHEYGIVHRDLKPANVFITRTRSGAELVKVLDFGIAKEVHADGSSTDLTAASMLIGTPKYMAPEQFLKKAADQRTDLYAVGLLLYQMLAGEAPFHSGCEVPAALLNMPEEFRIGWLHVNAAPAPLQLPPGLWDVIHYLLVKEPEGRYATAEDAIAALNHVDQTGPLDSTTSHDIFTEPTPSEVSAELSSQTGFPVFGEAPSGPVMDQAPRSRLPLILAVGAVVIAAGAGAAWYLNQAPIPEPAAAQVAHCADEVVSDPAGAAVFQGATQLGLTPLTVNRPCHEVWMLRIEREGHVTQRINLRGRAESRKTTVGLEPVLQPDAAPASPPDAAVAAPPPEPKPKKKRRWRPRKKPAPKPKPEASPLPF